MKAARLWEAGASLEAAFVQERCSSGRAKAPIQNLVMFAAGGLVACLTLAKMSDERMPGRSLGSARGKGILGGDRVIRLAA
jgi:hypothetical protein